MTDKFHKLYIALKFRLKGLGMHDAMRALEIGKSIHSGFRKDGFTPSFQHQIEIALDCFCQPGISDLEGAVICALLHDTDEDYPHAIGNNELQSFGQERYKTIRLLNKHTHDSFDECLGELAFDPTGSVIKGLDRKNNFQSMYRGKFTTHKVTIYRNDVVNLFLPMLKRARKNFPQQMDTYYNIEGALKSQLEFVNLLLEKEPV
jgi:hypothetical protein